MENASKAIIMAGGILIGVIILAILVIVFNSISDVYSQEEDSLLITQIEEYNRRFEVYSNRKGLYGAELLSLANLMNEYNRKLLESVNGDANDKLYKDNKVVIEVDFYNIVGDKLIDTTTGKDVTNKYGQEVKQYSKRRFYRKKKHTSF